MAIQTMKDMTKGVKLVITENTLLVSPIRTVIVAESGKKIIKMLHALSDSLKQWIVKGTRQN